VAHLRPIAALAAVACCSVLAAGCGDGDEDTETPAACLTGSENYVRVLAAAPEPVAFDDGTEISACLPPEQSGGQLAEVGQEMIAAATVLNARARQDPGGAASADLGYLVGAIEEGSGAIHADLVLRINSAARFKPGGGLLPASFERAFGEGYAAGKEAG
jgi:hypothetical protein